MGQNSWPTAVSRRKRVVRLGAGGEFLAGSFGHAGLAALTVLAVGRKLRGHGRARSARRPKVSPRQTKSQEQLRVTLWAHLHTAVFLDHALQEVVRQGEDGAGAVTRVDLAAAGAAVFHAREHLQRILAQTHSVSQLRRLENQGARCARGTAASGMSKRIRCLMCEAGTWRHAETAAVAAAAAAAREQRRAHHDS